MTTYSTKKEALTAARTLRNAGKKVQVLQHAGTYCQPGRGLASYCYFTVKVIG